MRAKRRNMVQVRARALKDIERLRERFTIKTRVTNTPTADYPYRIVIPAMQWRLMAAALAVDCSDYMNFKSEIAKTNPMRAQLYHEVWDTLRVIEQLEEF